MQKTVAFALTGVHKALQRLYGDGKKLLIKILKINTSKYKFDQNSKGGEGKREEMKKAFV